jgi:hypothetical protein
MNCGAFLAVFFDFPPHIAVIDFELPLQLLALPLLIKK